MEGVPSKTEPETNTQDHEVHNRKAKRDFALWRHAAKAAPLAFAIPIGLIPTRSPRPLTNAMHYVRRYTYAREEAG